MGVSKKHALRILAGAALLCAAAAFLLVYLHLADLKDLSVSGIEWVSTALAQNTGAKNNPATSNVVPDVAQIERLKNTGAVGEGNEGLLVIRDEKQITASDRALIKAENANRTKMINGMAREILRFKKLPETEKNIAQVRPQAARQFADVRRDNARPGWWVQSPSGAWTKK